MAKIKMSYEEIQEKISVFQNYINQHPERTRLHYAMEKFIKNTRRHIQDFGDQEADIRSENAFLENGKFVYIDVGSAMRPEKMLMTDPAKAKAQQKALRELGRKEVDVELYFCPEKDVPKEPKELSAAWIRHFIGVVIEKDPFDVDDRPSDTMKVTREEERIIAEATIVNT